MINLLQQLKADRSGASAAEYALIIAVLSALLIGGIQALGGGFNTAMTDFVARL